MAIVDGGASIATQCQRILEANMVEAIHLKAAEKRSSLDFKGLIRTYFKLYCDRSTIHGVTFLFDDSLNKIERICWTAIVIVSITLTITSFVVLSQQYNDETLITVVDNSQYPVFNVFFPAVAICSQKRVNWNKFEESKTLFLPFNATTDTHEIYYEFVKRMDSLRFGSFERFENMDDIDLEKLEFVNVTALALFLSYTCNDLFNEVCLWRLENQSCCDIFVTEKTEAGFCLVFNSIISGVSKKKAADDPFYPWRNSKSGEGSGLKISLKLDATSSNGTDTEGVYLMIKKPEQWSNVLYSIKGNTDTLVIIRPELTGTDPNTESTPPETRGCIFDKETNHNLFKNIKGLNYRQWNCFNVCHEEYLLKYCKCTLSMFFPFNETYRECSPADFRCIYKFRDVFSFDKRINEEAFVKNLQGGMLCPCLTSCDALEYFVTVSTLPTFNYHMNETKNISIDVHYQSEVMLKYRTSREFTFLELIASLGGLIGLFLGASLVSAAEIIYHLTFGLYIFLKGNHFFEYITDRFCRLFKFRWPKRTNSATTSSGTVSKIALHMSTNRQHY